MSEVVFSRCAWADIREQVAQVYREQQTVVDSFLEEHILAANCYQMLCGGALAGFFAIHAESTLVLFHVFDKYGALAQALFERVKRFEKLTNAMLPTGDEQFLSLAMDSFARLEKQAYFATYRNLPPRDTLLTLRQADIVRDRECLALSGDFLDGEIERIEKGAPRLRIYIAELGGEPVGFGVIEFSEFLTFASIGMYVIERHRRKGYAGDILYLQAGIAAREGYVPISGCWYYNHNSKKSMESIGGFAQTRLLRFHF